MKNFEITLLLIPDISQINLKNISDLFEKLVVEHKGSVVGKEDWGLRDLAYKIKNFKKAFYIFYQIKINSEKIQIMKKNLSINENVIRQLFINVQDHEKLPTKIIKRTE